MRVGKGRVPVVSTRHSLRSIPFFDLGQAEVQNLYLPGRRQEDIAWLDVAVQNALTMRRIQRIRHLHSQVQQPGVRHGPPVVELVQALTFQQLHHDEGLLAAFIEFVNSADAGMVQ